MVRYSSASNLASLPVADLSYLSQRKRLRTRRRSGTPSSTRHLFWQSRTKKDLGHHFSLTLRLFTTPARRSGSPFLPVSLSLVSVLPRCAVLLFLFLTPVVYPSFSHLFFRFLLFVSYQSVPPFNVHVGDRVCESLPPPLLGRITLPSLLFIELCLDPSLIYHYHQPYGA